MKGKDHKGREKGTKNKTFNIPILPSLSNNKKKPVIARDTPIPIDTIIKRVESGTYNLTPPYQRGCIWSNNFKSKLIASILTGIRINTIHVSLNPYDNTSYYVIDGKQRLEAIKSFKDGEIYVVIEKEKGNMLELNFQTLMRSNDPDVVLYRNKWSEYSLIITDHMIEGYGVSDTIAEHIRIFRNVNYSKVLSYEEHMLCPNFMARNFLKFIYDNGFNKVCGMGRTGIKSNDRLEALGCLLAICYTAFGPDLNDMHGFAFRNIKIKDITPSAEKLHNFLWNNEIYADTKLNIQLMKKIRLDEVCSKINKVSKWFYSILTFENDINKEILKGVLYDVMVLLLKKVEQNILTDSYVYSKGNLEKMYNWFVEYSKERVVYLKETGSNDCSARKDAIERRYDLAESIWKKFFKDEVKNKEVTAEGRRLALLESPERCVYSGERLRKDNVAVDHIIPKSFAKETEYMVISETSNLRKSDLNSEFMETYYKVIEKEDYKIMEKDKVRSAKRGVDSLNMFDCEEEDIYDQEDRLD